MFKCHRYNSNIAHRHHSLLFNRTQKRILSPAHSRWLPLKYFENINHTYRNVGPTQANIVVSFLILVIDENLIDECLLNECT